jgi:MFS family permease
LVLAQLAGRLNQRFGSVTVISVGCFIGAIGVGTLSFVTTTSPFLLAGVGYLLLGAGYGMLVPGTANVAMRDVPADVSGAAAGVLQASRQVGVSVGLAVLGSIGVNAATSSWRAHLQDLPANVRDAASTQALHVASAQIGTVTAAVGSSARDAATAAFVHGYRLAILVATCSLLGAAIVAFAGLRRRPAPSTGTEVLTIPKSAPAEV